MQVPSSTVHKAMSREYIVPTGFWIARAMIGSSNQFSTAGALVHVRSSSMSSRIQVDGV